VHEFRAHPIVGGGAGSFEAWWSEHRPLALFAVDSHSVYLQALAELGIAGFLLICVAFVCGAVAAFRESRSAHRPDELGTALAACFVAFAFAAAIDWMWELPAVAVVGVAALGLALGPGAPEEHSRARALTPIRVGISALAVACMIAALIPVTAALHLRASQRAFDNGDLSTARDNAKRARAVEPWAASPYTQLALVAERQKHLQDAAQWIDQAIARASNDWRLHLVAARLDTEQRRIPAARDQLALVRRLNPRLDLPGPPS
jgi:tetratricopeptide (TPR) repeat protein